MSSLRRWGLSALVLCLPVVTLSTCAVRAAEGAPSATETKSEDALIYKTLRDVINEGADMYNAQGRYKNMDRDFAGCYHLYEGALIMAQPLLRRHPDLQTAIDDYMTRARETPQMEKRAFVLREVIDKIREAVKPKSTTIVAPTPPSVGEKITTGKIVSGEKGKLTILVDGMSKTFKIPATAKVVINGKEGKLEELDAKRASTVTIFSKGDVVTNVFAHVEAKVPTLPSVVKETTTTGKIVNGEKGKLIVMVDGKNKTFAVPDTAKVIINDKEGKLDELDFKKATTVTITSKGDVVTKVVAHGEAKVPVPQPPKETTQSGKITKSNPESLTIKTKDDKEATFVVPATAKVLMDGEEAKLGDLREGASVTVTKKGGVVTKVEAKSPTPPPASTKTLWDRLGGETNVAKVVDDFVNTAGRDPKVNFWRDPTKVASKEEVADLKTKLVEFVSSATGGPLKYTGKSMKEVHKGMKITNEEFDAAAKDLKDALEKHGAKPADVEAVMKAVGGTRKDIVEVKGTEEKVKPEEKKPEEKKPEEKSSVSGVVTHIGKPVMGGVVILTDADGKEVKADLGADGTYKLNVKPGQYTVAVDAKGVPEKFHSAKTSALTFEVRKGKNAYDIVLQD